MTGLPKSVDTYYKSKYTTVIVLINGGKMIKLIILFN